MSENKPLEIEFNEQFLKALDVMENSKKNVFITGRAGTGKSTLLDYFFRTTKKSAAVLAPTGVAAVNVGGQTIHSFFGFKPGITLSKVKRLTGEKTGVFKALDAIIIDEASMIRADLLDCVDKFLRLNGPSKELPFGGIQIIFFGDLYQLPPVVTAAEKKVFTSSYASPYFFESPAFKESSLEFVELEKVYRQKDLEFIRLLNSIRNNTAGKKEFDALNARFRLEFESRSNDFFITLTTTNSLAEELNDKRLSELPGRVFTYPGEIKGIFGVEYLPSQVDLKVKKGAQVMLLNNDSQGRWFNGSVGRIQDIITSEGDETEKDAVIVELSDGRKVEVTPHKWEIFNFFLDTQTNSIDSKIIGSFTQYPIKLAWAITIHKSQGKTFDKVVIDLGPGTFAHGQLYVALSRCRTLEGIVLKTQLQKKHVFMDWNVARFVQNLHYHKSEEEMPLKEKIAVIENAISAKKPLKIVYLRPGGEKSRREIKPEFVGEMEYLGKKYVGVKAFCLERKDYRTFRVDRILEITKPAP